MVTLIAGTNRPGSRTLQIARHYARHLTQVYGEETHVVDLSIFPAEFISGHLRGQGLAEQDFRLAVEKMQDAGRLVWLFPEYNNSFPGVLKSFLDSFPFPNPLKGSVNAMVAISAGTNGGANALSHWADIIQYLGMVVVPQRVRIFGINQNWVGDDFALPVFNDLIALQAAELMALAPLSAPGQLVR